TWKQGIKIRPLADRLTKRILMVFLKKPPGNCDTYDAARRRRLIRELPSFHIDRTVNEQSERALHVSEQPNLPRTGLRGQCKAADAGGIPRAQNPPGERAVSAPFSSSRHVSAGGSDAAGLRMADQRPSRAARHLVSR